jgi:hypothetical protein
MEIETVQSWTGNTPNKKRTRTRFIKRVRFQPPGALTIRDVDETVAIVDIAEDGSITLTVITESHADGSPAGGVTYPISPPGPAQAWIP